MQATNARTASGVAAWARALLAALITVTSTVVAMPAAATVHDVVVGDVPVGWTPHVLDGRVNAIAEVGDRIVVGGNFDQVQEADRTGTLDQGSLFAFDAATGAIDRTFTPDVAGAVDTLVAAPDGRSVYVGGSFGSIDGVARPNLARIDLVTGAVDTTFAPAPNRGVLDLELVGDRLIAGGYFDRIGGAQRTVLAALDPVTGAADPDLALAFAVPYTGRDDIGLLSVAKLDATPDGTRLVAIGNFGEVDGHDRDQIVIVDLVGSPNAVVADWATDRFGQDRCAGAFDTYMRDVEIAPDGSYFVVVTTGAYRRDRMCDTASRWELAATGTDLQPTWVNYTGGDTLYGVGITGEAVYIGGHQRWVNNDWAGDAPGPGAVPREGLAALDPVNGMPLSWDPGRARGVGVFDIVAVDDGLYLGSDTDRVAWRYRGRLAKFPTAGGSAIPTAAEGPAVGDLYHLPSDDGERHPAYLHRVNAGGNALAAIDDGIDWSGDTDDGPTEYRNGGSSHASWSLVADTDGTVPASTPLEVYSSERWDPRSGEELQWEFPVDAGRDVEVRLYLANRCTCTDDPGERVFDVSIDGSVVLDDLDLSAEEGHDVATVRTFAVTSDGVVDIDFGHVTENPLVNAIEIVDPALLDVTVETPRIAPQRRPFDGAAVAGSTEVPGGPQDWSRARGAFMLSGRLYAGWSDGTMRAWDFDGSSYTGETVLDLHGLTSNEFPLASVTGMSFDHLTGRLYYTLEGDSTLHYRYFGTQTETVGARQFDADLVVPGLDWATVRGLHLDGDRVYAGAADGTLRRVHRTDGTVEYVSGPGVDGLDWHGVGLFAYAAAGYAPANVAPNPAVFVSCDGTTCTFGGSGSSDPDGSVTGWSWDFGDGAGGSGAGVTHSYAGEGTFDVTLTVTDDDGATATTTSAVTVSGAPVAVLDVACDELTCTFDASGSLDGSDPVVGYDWDLGDGTGASTAVVEHTYAATGTYDVTVTVTDDEGDTATATRSVTVFVPAEDIGLVGLDGSNAWGQQHTVTVPAAVRAGDQLLLFVSVSSTGAVLPDIPGWSIADTVVSGTMRTRLYTRTAATGDAGADVVVTLSSGTKTDVVLAAYEGVHPDVPVAEVAATAETSFTTAHTTPPATAADGSWVVSYWTDKTSGTTAWTLPTTVTERRTAFGTGGGRISSALADSGGPVAAGPVGGLTAEADSANAKATMWTVVLNARGADPAEPVAPVAVVDATCNGLTCTFDGSASSDPDGSIATHDWDLGDGSVASGPIVQHTYAQAGDHVVTLTVTDDQGLLGTQTTTVTVEVEAPAIGIVGTAGVNAWGVSHTVPVPAAAGAGDRLLLFVSVNNTSATLPELDGWVTEDTVTAGTLRTRLYSRVAQLGDAGGSVTVTLGSAAKADLVLAAYEGVDTTAALDVVGAAETAATAAHTTPTATAGAGAWVVSYWSDKTSATTAWTLPAGVTGRWQGTGQGGGRVSGLLADSGTGVDQGPVGGLTATADSANAKATMWTVVLPPR